MSDIVNSLTGGGGTQPTVVGGGIDAPFTFGTSPFDLQSIVQAFNQNRGSMEARYNQLGLGGSTMEQQDLGMAPTVTGGLPVQEQAVIGQEQTRNVGNPALNPALQPQILQFPNQQKSGSNATTLGELVGQAGAAGAGGASAGSDAAIASDVLAAGIGA